MVKYIVFFVLVQIVTPRIQTVNEYGIRQWVYPEKIETKAQRVGKEFLNKEDALRFIKNAPKKDPNSFEIGDYVYDFKLDSVVVDTTKKGEKQ